eukprot:COSAG01_NODE_8027_length_2949_cov_69.698947_3_plen_253_part_00
MSSSEGEEEEGDGSALLRKSTGGMGETTEEQIARLRAERDAEREKLELAAAMGEQVVASNLDLERTSEAAAAAAAEAQAQVAALEAELEDERYRISEIERQKNVLMQEAMRKQEETEMDTHAQMAQQREWAEEDTETGAGGAGETQSPPNTSPTKAEEAAAAEEAAQMQAQMEQMAAQLELAKQEAAELASRCDAEQSQRLESDRRAREAEAAKLKAERVRCAHGPQRSLEPLPPQPQSRTAERIEETARAT